MSLQSLRKPSSPNTRKSSDADSTLHAARPWSAPTNVATQNLADLPSSTGQSAELSASRPLGHSLNNYSIFPDPAPAFTSIGAPVIQRAVVPALAPATGGAAALGAEGGGMAGLAELVGDILAPEIMIPLTIAGLVGYGLHEHSSKEHEATLLEARGKPQNDPPQVRRYEDAKTVPAARDANGKCGGEPPPKFRWQGEGNAHGSTAGYHWHWNVWNLNPNTCNWTYGRKDGPEDPGSEWILIPGRW